MLKKGQVTDQFNWVFAVVAGGIILLLFLFIIGQLQAVGDAKLGASILQSMDAIITGSEATDNAVTFIPINNLFSLLITCDEDSRLLIENSVSSMDIRNRLIYAPTSVGSKELFVATKPLARPFPLGNAVLFSDEDILFLVYRPVSASTDNNAMLDEVVSFFPRNVTFMDTGIFQPVFSKYKKVIVITTVDPPNNLRQTTETYPGVSVLRNTNAIWIKINTEESAELSSKTQRESTFTSQGTVTLPRFDFVTMLAYSGSKEFFECSLNKLHQRLRVVSMIYMQRAETLQTSDLVEARCRPRYAEAIPELRALTQSLTAYNLQDRITALERINRNLLLASCPLLY